MNQDVVLVDILTEVCNSIKVKDISKVFPIFGRSIQVQSFLVDKNQSITKKGEKYPLMAVYMPFRVLKGGDFHAVAKIDKISFFTSQNNQSSFVAERYLESGNYKKILYPVYKEFLFRLAAHKNTVNGDPEAFPHIQMDDPGIQPLTQGMTDYVDAIHLIDLEIKLNQTKTCKK